MPHKYLDKGMDPNSPTPAVTPPAPQIPAAPAPVETPPVVTPPAPPANPGGGRKKKIFIIISVVVLVIFLILAILVGIGLASLRNSASKSTESTEENGTKITAYQFDDSTRVDYSNPCFTTKIPGTAKVETKSAENCTMRVVMPDTTLPFIQVASITDMEGLTAKQAIQAAKTQYDDLYKQAGNDKATTKITEDVGLANLPAHRLDYSDGTFSFVSYFVEVPEDKNYMEEGEKIGAFLVNGYNNNVATDVFTKYTLEFISNLRFK